MGLSLPVKLMKGVLQMFQQMTFEDLHNATFLPELLDGAMPCNLPDGRQTVRSGLEAAPVRLSARPENKKDLLMSGICGQHSSISSKSAALNMSLANRLKMRLSTVGSIEYIETWKQKATPAGVLYWAHTASVPRIKDKGYIGDAPLLTFPTPTQNNATRAGKQGRMGGENLQTAVMNIVRTWATITTQDFKTPVQKETKQKRLRAEVMTVAAYHTPRANDSVKNGAIANDPRNGLPAQVLIMPWPTILSSEARQGFQDRTRGKKGSQESLSTVIYRVIQVILGSVTNSSTAKTERFGGYRLNPYFSAWLMGFPKEWTEAGMAAFQKLTVSRSRSKKRGDRCS